MDNKPGNLVLARKEGEAILIGNNVSVTVVTAKNGIARLRISAPAEVRVDREEIRERVIESGMTVGEVR